MSRQADRPFAMTAATSCSLTFLNWKWSAAAQHSSGLTHVLDRGRAAACRPIASHDEPISFNGTTSRAAHRRQPRGRRRHHRHENHSLNAALSAVKSPGCYCLTAFHPLPYPPKLDGVSAVGDGTGVHVLLLKRKQPVLPQCWAWGNISYAHGRTSAHIYICTS
jgi:hypothetical protein